jgi:hypothetical protein
MLRIGILLIALAVTFGYGSAMRAQENTYALELSDEDQIKQAALDYCEGWYEGDAERMEDCLHPELAKRIIRTDPATGRSKLENMGAMRLVQYTRKGYGTKTPAEAQQKDVVVLDVYENVACARATMSGWIDYMHLAKWNGRWVIVNVLWELKPEDK